MLELGRELDLAEEALGAERGGELGTELALDGVAVGQSGLEAPYNFGQVTVLSGVMLPG